MAGKFGSFKIGVDLPDGGRSLLTPTSPFQPVLAGLLKMVGASGLGGTDPDARALETYEAKKAIDARYRAPAKVPAGARPFSYVDDEDGARLFVDPSAAATDSDGDASDPEPDNDEGDAKPPPGFGEFTDEDRMNLARSRAADDAAVLRDPARAAENAAVLSREPLPPGPPPEVPAIPMPPGLMGPEAAQGSAGPAPKQPPGPTQGQPTEAPEHDPLHEDVVAEQWHRVLDTANAAVARAEGEVLSAKSRLRASQVAAAKVSGKITESEGRQYLAAIKAAQTALAAAVRHRDYATRAAQSATIAFANRSDKEAAAREKVELVRGSVPWLEKTIADYPNDHALDVFRGIDFQRAGPDIIKQATAAATAAGARHDEQVIAQSNQSHALLLKQSEARSKGLEHGAANEFLFQRAKARASELSKTYGVDKDITDVIAPLTDEHGYSYETPEQYESRVDHALRFYEDSYKVERDARKLRDEVHRTAVEKIATGTEDQIKVFRSHFEEAQRHLASLEADYAKDTKSDESEKAPLRALIRKRYDQMAAAADVHNKFLDRLEARYRDIMEPSIEVGGGPMSPSARIVPPNLSETERQVVEAWQRLSLAGQTERISVDAPDHADTKTVQSALEAFAGKPASSGGITLGGSQRRNLAKDAVR